MRSSLLGYIKEQSNCSFVLMKSILLLNRDTAQNGIVTVNVVKAGSLKVVEQFGVKIEELLLEQERYHQKLAEISGVTFQGKDWRVELMEISGIRREE